MENAMLTKSKFAGAALATLALVGCLVTNSESAQAHPRFGVGLGIGIATGALIGAAAASGAYAGPVYGYRECRYVQRYDRWGNIRLIKVCDVY
jgi:anaerobic C4-dicarboxylate transporter